MAAEQLGLNRSTCSNWANDAATISIRPRRASKKHADYPRLRSNGASRRDAALAVGASKQSSYQWDRQQAAQDKEAVCGDNADLPYKQEVTTTFAEPLAPAAAPELTATVAEPGPAPMALEALEQPISTRYL